MNDTSSPQYRCLVNLCPMTGGIFLNGPQAPGICAFHHGGAGSDMPRVTQILLDWECVTYEVNLWRCSVMQVELDKQALAKAWTRLQPALGEAWSAELAPAAGVGYVQWGHKLERFLLARVKEALRRTPA